MESDVTQSATLIKLWTWFNQHARQLLMGAGAVIVIGIIIGFVSWRSNAKQLAANEALSQVLNRGFVATPEGAPVVGKIADDFPQTEAAGRALLFAGSRFYVEGNFPQAEAQFKRFIHDFPTSPWIPQANLGVAACLDSSGKANEAIAAYKDVVDRHPTSSVTLQAKIALGRLYEAQGNLTQARDLYDDLMRNVGGSIAQEAAMLLDQLFTQHPELMPSRQAAASAAAEAPALRASTNMSNTPTLGTNVPASHK